MRKPQRAMFSWTPILVSPTHGLLWHSLTYGVCGALLLVEWSQLGRLREQVAFWGWSRSVAALTVVLDLTARWRRRATFGTLCYVLMLAHVHTASALVAVLRDSRRPMDEDVVLIWFFAVKLLDVLLKSLFGVQSQISFLKLIPWSARLVRSAPAGRSPSPSPPGGCPSGSRAR